MIYKTFKQWKNGKFLEHFGPRKANYSQDQLDLIEMGWKYGYVAGVEAEREECAKLCDELSDKDGFEGCYADACAQAIRARGKNDRP